jgi:hypothetical protein
LTSSEAASVVVVVVVVVGIDAETLTDSSAPHVVVGAASDVVVLEVGTVDVV